MVDIFVILTQTKPKLPKEFAAELFVKLKQLKQDRDNQELVEKKLNSVSIECVKISSKRT